jgi:HEAT repeat protein
MRSSLLAMAISAAAIPIPCAVSSAQPAAPVAESPEQAIQRELNQQADILTSPTSRAEQREQAAERLVQRQRPDAQDILLSTLGDKDNRPAQIAVAKALASDPRPDARFIEPLMALLGRDSNATRAATAALNNYPDNPQVLADLIRFAASGSQVPKSRVAVIRGIGAFVKKNAAAFLITLMNNVDEDPQVRGAAPQALVDMTGLDQIGTDVQQWNLWWAASANQPDAQWEAAQLRSRAGHYDQVKQELRRLTDHIQEVLEREYQRAAKDQRPEILLAWLKDSEPAIRAVAARTVLDEKINSNRIAVNIIEQLRGMIGDSAVDVRKAVIDALREINDAASVDLLLAQVAVETDPDVKISIAATLARLQQLRAVDALLTLLNGSSTRVAEAAAEALRDMGETLRKDVGLVARVSTNLRDKLTAITGKPGSDALRGTLLEALAQLRDPALLRVFITALDANDPRTTVKIRVAACKGLGGMTQPLDQEQAAAELVNAVRRDPDAAVRLEAVRAIGNVGSFTRQAPALYEQTGSRETDKSVRDTAWQVLASLLTRPDANVNVLMQNWLDRFKDDPSLKADPKRRAIVLERRLIVLQAIRDKLVADPQAAKTLAGIHQNIGEAFMSLDQWDKAAASFRASMSYWQTHNAQAVTIAQLSDQLLGALLRAGNYSEAVQFAGERIAADPQELGSMGYLIRTEVERLKDSKRMDDVRSAAQLIDETDKMQPPLRGPYADTLKQYRQEIRQRLANSAGSPN